MVFEIKQEKKPRHTW